MAASPFGMLVPMLLIFLIFYFLLIRPQQRRQREQETMLKGLEKGDDVVTAGGLHGKVVGVTDDVLTLEIAALKGERVRVKVSRSKIESASKPKKEARSVITGQRVRLVSVAATVLLLSYYAAANCFSEPTRRREPADPRRRHPPRPRPAGRHPLGAGRRSSTPPIQHELEYLRSALVEELAEDGVTLGARRGVGRAAARPGRARAPNPRRCAPGSRSATCSSPRPDPTARSSTRSRRPGSARCASAAWRRCSRCCAGASKIPIQGIPDSVVTRQGTDRILVQIPGGQIDRTRARELLKVTGFLEFKIVREIGAERGAAAREARGRPPARHRDRLRARQGVAADPLGLPGRQRRPT